MAICLEEKITLCVHQSSWSNLPYLLFVKLIIQKSGSDDNNHHIKTGKCLALETFSFQGCHTWHTFPSTLFTGVSVSFVLVMITSLILSLMIQLWCHSTWFCFRWVCLGTWLVVIVKECSLHLSNICCGMIRMSTKYPWD